MYYITIVTYLLWHASASPPGRRMCVPTVRKHSLSSDCFLFFITNCLFSGYTTYNHLKLRQERKMLTCIVVKNRRHVLGRVAIGGVSHQHAGLSNRIVTDDHTAHVTIHVVIHCHDHLRLWRLPTWLLFLLRLPAIKWTFRCKGAFTAAPALLDIGFARLSS